jgi:hypothetical protein
MAARQYSTAGFFIKEISIMRAVLTLAFVLFAGVANADPVGKYEVTGTNPGGKSTYTGQVTVERTGDTYRVVWNVGGTRYVGTGIGNKEFIAVSYRSGDQTGLALYAEDGDGWGGVWTYAGGKQMGTEKWERQ